MEVFVCNTVSLSDTFIPLYIFDVCVCFWGVVCVRFFLFFLWGLLLFLVVCVSNVLKFFVMCVFEFYYFMFNIHSICFVYLGEV